MADADNKRVTLRCHPNYKNEGPWYDWVIVRFSTEGVQYQRNNAHSKRSFLKNGGKQKNWQPILGNTQYDDGFVPCKVLAIAENPNDKSDIRILVHGCKYPTNQLQTQNDTVLLEFWQLAYHNRYDDLPRDFQEAQKIGLPPNVAPHHLVPHLSWVTLDSLYARCLVVKEEPGVFESVPLTNKGKEKNWVMLIQDHNSW